MVGSRSSGPDSADHYARLAGNYDSLWDHTPQFKAWMVEHILDIVPLPPTPLIADVGGGTGLFAAELMRQLNKDASVLLLDPSAEMLERAPSLPGLRTVCAPAEQSRRALEEIGVHDIDLMLIKEAVHHFAAPAATLRDLASTLGSQGSLLVVMLPTQIEYPLFAAALKRFSELQPDPAAIAEHLASAGLKVNRVQRSFNLQMAPDQWLQMVANRFMSLLSTFDDEQLASGLEEIKAQLASRANVCFRDTFEFVLGTRGTQ